MRKSKTAKNKTADQVGKRSALEQLRKFIVMLRVPRPFIGGTKDPNAFWNKERSRVLSNSFQHRNRAPYIVGMNTKSESKEYLLTRTISYKTRFGWVEEKYHLGKTLARQEICREDGSVQKRLVWTEYGALLLEENCSAPDEIAEAVERDGQVVVRREYYASGRVQSELVAVEMDYYYEGSPQLFFVAVTYDEDGRVMSRSHAKAA